MTTETAREPTLAELSDEERNERFDHLQERMRGVWEIMRRNEVHTYRTGSRAMD